MNLFKTDPKKIFEFVMAIITVIFAYYMGMYFVRTGSPTRCTKEPIIPPSTEKKESDKVDYKKSGAVHISVESPSYAKSNVDVNPLTPVTIYFNEVVDLDDAEAKFSLINKDTGEEVPVNVSGRLRTAEIDDKDKYDWSWQEYWKHKVIFAPIVELSPISMYRVDIEPGILIEEGEKTTAQGMNFEFMTADFPGVLNTNIEDEDSALKPGEHIKIIFKSPMLEEELKSAVIISPAVDFEVIVNDKVMTIVNNFKEAGDYTITLPGELKDLYGRELGEEDLIYTFSITL